jgi:aminopeptidase N
MISPPSAAATRSWIPSIVAHELAHQWYGDLLTARTNREMWLNEGFATFFAADWEVHARRAKEGDAAADALAAAQADGWRRASLDAGGLAGRWFLGGDGNHNVYNKGAITLTMLRRYLGEDVFWAGIRDYTRGHVHQSVDTLDLQRALEARSGRDLAWFFEQWTELPGVPKLTTSWAWTPEGGGTLTVTVTQAPAKGHAAVHPYTLPVDVSVDGAAPVRGWMTGESLTVTMAAAKAPTWVAFDPAGALLADWDQAQSPEAWAAQLRHGPPYARLLALHALADVPPPADDPLPALFADPTTPEPLREALADALGTRRTCAPLWPAAEGDRDERVRAAAASALGSCTTREVVPAMLARLAKEPNSDVRAALLRSASAIDPWTTLPAARKELGRTDALPPETAAAATALGVAGTPADVPTLLAAPPDRDTRLAGLHGAVLLVQRQALGPARDALRGTVARAAERLLGDLDLRGQQGAIAALRDVGDARSAALLEAFARASTVPDLARTARDAATAITGRVDTVAPATPNDAAARLKAVEDRVKALEDAEGVERR